MINYTKDRPKPGLNLLISWCHYFLLSYAQPNVANPWLYESTKSE